MSYGGPSSYLPTTDKFIAHWEAVNVFLNPDPLVLPSGYGIADLQAHRAALATAMTGVQNSLNLVQAERTNRDNQKEPIRERIRQLGNFIRGALPNSENLGQLTPLVQMGASIGEWTNQMDKAAHIWLQVNTDPPAGFTPPLLLFGGYTQAQFATDIAALKATFTLLVNTGQDLENARSLRERVFDEMYQELTRYRDAVIAWLPPGNELIDTIPRLSPLPGHTPDPVALTGEWNDTLLRADFSWTASTDEDLDHYELRYCAGTDYDTDFESSVGIIPKEETTYSTNEGLLLAGSTSVYKVYVVLTTDNERGSNEVAITHPGGPIPPGG